MTHAASPHNTPVVLRTPSQAVLPSPKARLHSHQMMTAKTVNTTPTRAAACVMVPENRRSSAVAAVVVELQPAFILSVLPPALRGVAAAVAGLDEVELNVIAKAVPTLSSCTVRMMCLPFTNCMSRSDNF